jgi:magnesium transporter
VGFTVTPKTLLTVRFTRLRVFDSVHEALASAAGPVEAPTVFILLLEAVVDRDADLLEHVASELEAISRAVFHDDARKRGQGMRNDESLRQTLSAVGRIGDRLSEIRASLHGLGRIVPFACQVAGGWIGADQFGRLNAIRQDIVSLDDFETHLATKSQFLLDAVLGFINTQQNELFKILTIVSVVGVPPTLFASIWGMNFHHMPELAWRGGYPMAVFLILASGVVPMLWFKWKRWW